MVAELAPDVVLMDLRMPRCDGVEATRRIRARAPGTQVVVLTTYADDESLFPALRPERAAISPRTPAVTRSCGPCRSVLSGDAGLSPSVQRRLLERLSAAEPSPAAAAGGCRTGSPPARAEVLALIAEGLSNPEIARRLHVSTATVKTHINNLFAKAGLHDRAQAVRYAYREGPGAATGGLSHLMG